jgi:hypothetical protein
VSFYSRLQFSDSKTVCNYERKEGIKMKNYIIATLAVFLYHIQPAAASNQVDIPAECRNLALMQGQLITTGFHSNAMGGGTYNPASLTLKAKNGLKIGKIEYLGGDSEDPANAGQYACDKDQTLCTNPADAGGAINWSRLTITTGDATPFDIAEVVVSMGSRGGCTISSAKHL